MWNMTHAEDAQLVILRGPITGPGTYVENLFHVVLALGSGMTDKDLVGCTSFRIAFNDGSVLRYSDDTEPRLSALDSVEAETLFI